MNGHVASVKQLVKDGAKFLRNKVSMHTHTYTYYTYILYTVHVVGIFTHDTAIIIVDLMMDVVPYNWIICIAHT